MMQSFIFSKKFKVNLPN